MHKEQATSGLGKTKHLCFRNKRLKKFKDRDDVKCYSHHLHGWIVLVDGIFHCEDGRTMPLEEVKIIADNILPNGGEDWMFVQEVFYLRIIKKPLSPQQWSEARNKIRQWQGKDPLPHDPQFVRLCQTSIV